MTYWRVKLHYPKRIGSVEYFYVEAETRQEAINSVLPDAKQTVIPKRGLSKKVTARRYTRKAILKSYSPALGV